MNNMSEWCAAMIAIIGLLVYTSYVRCKTRKILQSIDKMLDAAIEGHFIESCFDETLLSSVEAKFAHYLTASEVSYKRLSQEKNKIKELIGDISHQTKTPIANILIYSQLLKEQEIPKEACQYIDVLNIQAEKLQFLINALIKSSRLETGVIHLIPKKNNIHLLIETVIAEAKAQMEEKSIDFQYEISGEEEKFDFKWTAEAIYNILDNAIKYTPNGGAIRVKAYPYELFFRMDIADSGRGIMEEEIPLIFKRFYRSQSVCDIEGVGIGLFLARQIISMQGGYIKVKSRMGEGSTFSIFLPKS